MTAVPSKDKGTYRLAVAAGVAGGMVLCMLMAFAAYLCNNSSSTSSIIPQVIPQLGPELTPVVLSGVGDKVIDVAQYSTYGTAHFRHNGKSNFIVIPYGSDGERHSSIINDIGAYDGTVIWDKTAARLEIKADGGWTIELKR